MSEESFPLTQFIFVDPNQSRLEVIHDAALASARALSVLSEDWKDWFETDYRKSVRALKRLSDADSDSVVACVERDGMLRAAATVPTWKEALPSALKRTQVTGWEKKVIDSEPSSEDTQNTLLINNSLGMSTGKMAAQAAHALMLFVKDTTAVPDFSVVLASEEILRSADGYAVTDNGLTEIPAGSLTAVFKR